MISILERSHGSPDHGNKCDPLDELIYIILSQMTTAKSFGRVFDRLRRAVPDWSALAREPIRKLRILIKDAGLSNQKAPRIKAIVHRLMRDFGSADLSALGLMSDADAQAYLTSLPGVGVKTAKCVLMYSLGRPVLPVDTHVARVSRRLGLVPSEARGARIDQLLGDVIPPASRYSFHVNAVAHGQRFCLAMRPRCSLCPLARSCPTFGA